MMLIRTRVAPSPIHGVGLFTEEPIRRGDPVWFFTDSIDLRVTPELAELLGEDFIKRYAYHDESSEFKIISLDDSRFMNHSFDPNTHYDRWHGWATRPISVGEELTCDYRECGVMMEGIK